MSTVEEDLDKIQLKLHDPDEKIWTRAELLRKYNDGYGRLVAESGCFSQPSIFDIPGRFTCSHCYDWEDRHLTGTFWMCMVPTYYNARRTTFWWEAEQLEGITPTASAGGTTQLWEICHTGEVDRYFRFGLPKNSEHIRRVAWDDMAILPISTRELDETDSKWFNRVGRPRWWTPGTGRIRSIEVFEIRTDYQQGYAQLEYEAGIPRQFSGARTYGVEISRHVSVNSWGYTTSADSGSGVNLFGMGFRFTKAAADTSDGFGVQLWEAEFLDGETVFTTGSLIGVYSWEVDYGADRVDFGTGLIRSISSPDRQYLALLTGVSVIGLLGAIREFRSSVLALSVLETLAPDGDLTEDDVPDMIPGPMQKYIRFYVLARAYERIGEGQKPDLAKHYDARFQRGIAVMKRFADVGYMDHVYTRDPAQEQTGRPPRVRLPSTFERMW